ncbi:hypothetical protein, partial [Lactiplantibacillus plantarum]|uniref:hypothetical protein n=1 Tax=Lactiplantibacillus plantarum TaxID=1590 RepID=UPI001C9D7128
SIAFVPFYSVLFTIMYKRKAGISTIYRINTGYSVYKMRPRRFHSKASKTIGTTAFKQHLVFLVSLLVSLL